MNHRKPGLKLISLILVLSIYAVCCTYKPTDGITATAAGKVSEWDYVALGNSFSWGFIQEYAAIIEADLGIKVTLHNWSSGGQLSNQLLMTLRENKKLRKDIQEAEVITFLIPMGILEVPTFSYINKTCGGAENQDCLLKALAQYKADTDAIIAEILSLRGTHDTVIRSMDCYFPPFLFEEWKKKGVYKELRPYYDVFNDYVVQVASEHGIPVARVSLAFNGSDGNANPIDYIGPDGWHTNKAGAVLIAELHRALGYEPLSQKSGIQKKGILTERFRESAKGQDERRVGGM